MKEDTFKKAEMYYILLEQFAILKNTLKDEKQFYINASSGKGHISCIIPDPLVGEFKSLLLEWANEKAKQIRDEFDKL